MSQWASPGPSVLSTGTAVSGQIASRTLLRAPGNTTLDRGMAEHKTKR